MAVTERGAMYSWGSGEGGQLGTGLSESSSLPKPVAAPADVGGWVLISAGEYHSVAVSDAGGVYTWGMNTSGQLGHGDLARRPSPTRVVALMGSRAQAVAAGQAFCLVATSSTEVLSWGHNGAGQLGLGDREERRSPQAVVRLRGVAVVQISCGGRHAAALDRDGGLWTWGDNGGGRLGHGDGEDRSLPTRVANSQDMALEQVACGYGHTLARSALDLAEVQSRDFFLTGLVHHDEPLEAGFCLYPSSPSAQYRPLSAAAAFFARHGVPLAPEPIVVLDPPGDPRLRDVLARLQRLAERGPTQLERVRLAAVGVHYELGGAQARLNAAAERHAASLVERAPLPSGLVPLGRMRIGDARHRAGLMKLLCDRMGLRCCLVRGAVPQVAACGCALRMECV